MEKATKVDANTVAITQISYIQFNFMVLQLVAEL